MDAVQEEYDVVIVGGGHNGLVAATYLAKTGKSVLLLERQDHIGGATVSAQAFPGVDARLSRYSYLISLLPRQIIADLDLDLELIRRRYSSYTPLPGTTQGLLVDNNDDGITAASFAAIGAGADVDGFSQLYERTGKLARRLWPTMMKPLLRRSEARDLVGDDQLWDDFMERPIGEVIERSVQNDLVRGVVLTDGLISTYARAHEPDLSQNRCFFYHVTGGGTGDWDVPVGGMGALTDALARAADAAAVQMFTGAEVTHVSPDGQVRYELDGKSRSLQAGRVLSNAAPAVLERLLGNGQGTQPSPPSRPEPEGAQAKVNLLLSRLPKLKDPGVAPEAAFGGTFHINELYSQLETAYEQAGTGQIPDPLPAEIYCHSLADPSILSPELRGTGAHTLTVFTLHTPHRLLTEENNERMRSELQAATLASLNTVLAEPIEDCLLRDSDGGLCVETKTTLDLEHTLNMPGGNIFHGPLSWPFVEDDAPLDTAAQRWGVATGHDRILLCGAGSQRGGGVSGLGGYSAAMAVLEDDAAG
ncbi:phytoene desaturase family protein [Arthrobacter sp. H14]|uniref:phytoene desaturase family protein n=1 Tax=Arthrobacter sp. H14 TaxID=1312959 RepID=UPI000478D0E4|nr:NAD(P)/FAD-dependent oxidoreductase [Arthrobacter sp. H14]